MQGLKVEDNLQLNKKLNYPDSKIKIYHKHKSCGKY